MRRVRNHAIIASHSIEIFYYIDLRYLTMNFLPDLIMSPVTDSIMMHCHRLSLIGQGMMDLES
jgi:hypothetical protein